MGLTDQTYQPSGQSELSGLSHLCGSNVLVYRPTWVIVFYLGWIVIIVVIFLLFITYNISINQI